MWRRGGTERGEAGRGGWRYGPSVILPLLLSCTPVDVEDPPPPLPDACDSEPLRGDSGLDSGGDSGAEGLVLGCEVSDHPDLVTSKTVEVELSDPSTARLVCTLQGDPHERHVLESEQTTTTHRFVLHGLLAASNYECLVDLGEDGASLAATFSTDPLPDWVRLPVLDGDPAASWGAYTLLNHFVGGKKVDEQKLVIFDCHGRVRWYLDVRDDITNVDVSYVGDGQLLYGGGFGGPPRIVDLDGDVIWESEGPYIGKSHHHDVEMLPSGRVASLVTTSNQDGSTAWTGFGVEIVDVPSGALVWSYDSQQAVDAGELETGAGDPYHANALQVVEVDGVLQDVYVNLRDINTFVRIDPVTERFAWTLGPDGDFDLVQDDGTPAGEGDWFYWPHAPEVDGDRVLFFDNRNPRPDEETSRGVEFTLDLDDRTARVSWEWTERDFREQAWGDIDRLPSGDVLLGIGHCAACSASDPQSRTAVVEVDRSTGEVIWRLRWEDDTDGLYRAQRLSGCELFANAATCPSLDDR